MLESSPSVSSSVSLSELWSPMKGLRSQLYRVDMVIGTLCPALKSSRRSPNRQAMSPDLSTSQRKAQKAHPVSADVDNLGRRGYSSSTDPSASHASGPSMSRQKKLRPASVASSRTPKPVSLNRMGRQRQQRAVGPGFGVESDIVGDAEEYGIFAINTSKRGWMGECVFQCSARGRGQAARRGARQWASGTRQGTRGYIRLASYYVRRPRRRHRLRPLGPGVSLHPLHPAPSVGGSQRDFLIWASTSRLFSF
jgi:hypothetical protein